jgi:hypothetical protein
MDHSIQALATGKGCINDAQAAVLSHLTEEEQIAPSWWKNRQLTHRTVRTQDSPDFWVLGGLRATLTLSDQVPGKQERQDFDRHFPL